MYLAIVVLLMGVFPAASVVAEAAFQHGGAEPDGSHRQVVRIFWSVGVRLILAGLRQIMNPAFAAQTIFGIRDQSAFAIVRELGSEICDRGWRLLAFQSGMHARGACGRPFLWAGRRRAPARKAIERRRRHRNGLGSCLILLSMLAILPRHAGHAPGLRAARKDSVSVRRAAKKAARGRDQGQGVRAWLWKDNVISE